MARSPLHVSEVLEKMALDGQGAQRLPRYRESYGRPDGEATCWYLPNGIGIHGADLQAGEVNERDG